MANGIDWFRWHHGSVNDPKFGLVAKKAGARVGDVIAVWALVLEQASANVERGLCGDIDCEATDFLLGADDGTTVRILEAMRARGLITGGKVCNPKRFIPYISNRPSTDVWAALRAAIFGRDNYTCQYCGARGVKLECDHVDPVANGGSHDLSNLVAACFKCNRSKGSKTVAEWRSRHGR